MNYLFKNRTTNGDSAAEFAIAGKQEITLFAWGAFGGGTVSLRIIPSGVNEWFTPLDASFAAKGAVNIKINGPCRLRANLVGATSPNVNFGFLV